jgi:salicylate hydroxylase
MKKIAIIGAGISGLFVANLFKENLDYQVAIYEKNTSINLDEGIWNSAINKQYKTS